MKKEEEKEDKIVEQKPMSEEEFKEKIHEVAKANRKKLINDFNKGIIHLRSFEGGRIFRSIRRAIRRGHMSLFGDVYPRRPFNNRKRNKKGDITYERKRIYEQLNHKQDKVS